MHERALISIASTRHRLREMANTEGNASDEDSLDRFAVDLGFDSWDSLDSCITNSAVLFNDHVTGFSRILRTDMKTAWRFLSDSSTLSKWMLPAEFKPMAGEPFNFAPEGWHGTIGIFEEEREIRFDAVAGGWTWFRLHCEDDTTILRLWDYLPPDFVVPDDVRKANEELDETQPGGAGTHWQGVLAGWHSGLDQLASEFTELKEEIPYLTLDRLYKLLIRDYHKPH